MGLLHQLSAIVLGEGDTHLWSATKGGNPIPATILVTTRNNQQSTHTSLYHSRPVETSFKKAAGLDRFTRKTDYM